MKTAALHLNLLKSNEVLSSSPVRLRVMLPVGALLACVGLLVWWGVLFTQIFLAKTQARSIKEDLATKNSAHAEAIQKRETARELKQQLEQLEFYKAGVRAIGAPLAKFAEVVPMRVQLKELSISKPRPQVLMPPGAKVPLFGPIENVETQKLVIVGLATKETPVVSLMESLESGFETLVTGEHNVNSFKQDNTEIDGKRLLSFEIEYSMPGRRFAK
ncbi:MAG: hypothetical protein J6Q49_01095 [Kiritimatiellae bacterium]|nr:hypothetical protein [Kiritimatiellia bacterium]